MQLLEKCWAETAAHSRRKLRFKNKLMSLDGSIIELSATMFDWAKQLTQDWVYFVTRMKTNTVCTTV